MAVEIERKFRVLEAQQMKFAAMITGESKVSAVKVLQGYLMTEKGQTVRARFSYDLGTGEKKGYITLKFKEENLKFGKQEFEYEIPAEDALHIITTQCKDRVILKTRLYVMEHANLWEVDVFQGRHSGLVVAEIELSSEKAKFPKPAWLGKELTDEKEYSNKRLAISGAIPESWVMSDSVYAAVVKASMMQKGI